MIKINFLPWRENLRRKQQRKLIIMGVFCLVVLGVTLLVFKVRHKNIKIINYKLVGVIATRQKKWALLLLPNHKLIKAQMGDRIGDEVVRKILLAKVCLCKGAVCRMLAMQHALEMNAK